ncbi:hypothetical protein AO724_02590 [Aeromonas allosaccharophila]|nr:hypothetical protein AO724_02590 [Aeromonas allosaccharophila]
MCEYLHSMGINETRTAPNVVVLVKAHSQVQPRNSIHRHRQGVYNDMIKNNLFKEREAIWPP